MRLFRLLPALGVPFGARAFSFESRERDPRPLSARDIDVCACINAELVVPNSLGIQTPVGVLDACLCLSALYLFLETNVIAILAVTTAGESAVLDIVTGLIADATTKSNCVFPPHSRPNCSENNLCGFECIDGFTPSPLANPKECKCPPANVVGGRRAWECIDTVHDLESHDDYVAPPLTQKKRGANMAEELPQLDDEPDDEENESEFGVSTNAGEELVPVNWPVGDDTWITTTGVVAVYISRYRLYEEGLSVGRYTLEFTNTVKGTYRFQHETGVTCDVDTFDEGNHTLQFNSDEPTVTIISLRLI
ncbi:hypothetical protein BC827DRAFT_256215 [Russula dissimulans]|nr:hypothetical protein BC827DRAFT_256215 [Russula dissimulans]